MKTMDGKKAGELFEQISSLSFDAKHLVGIVQNPDFMTEDIIYKSYMEFEQAIEQSLANLSRIEAELHRIKGEVGALCKEIDPDDSHTYEQINEETSHTMTYEQAFCKISDQITMIHSSVNIFHITFDDGCCGPKCDTETFRITDAKTVFELKRSLRALWYAFCESHAFSTDSIIKIEHTVW